MQLGTGTPVASVPMITESERCRTLPFQELHSQSDSPGFKGFMKEKTRNTEDLGSLHLDSVTAAG